MVLLYIVNFFYNKDFFFTPYSILGYIRIYNYSYSKSTVKSAIVPKHMFWVYIIPAADEVDGIGPQTLRLRIRSGNAFSSGVAQMN